jgi:nuclear pore complex protein Nup107
MRCTDEVEKEFKRLREAYLPETILAYISTLQYCGEALSRDLLMECMDLSSILAAEDSDVLELFMKVGRMQELVEAFASAGKSLLLITSAKGSSSKSKKLRTKGWTPELWTVKS